MGIIKNDFCEQKKEYLKNILCALNELCPKDRNYPFYENYKNEVLDALKK